jgi:hypothetical protein
MRRLAAFAAVLCFATIPRAFTFAQAPNAASGTVKPGTYDLELTTGGGVLQGTLALTAAGDSLTAKIHVGDHDAPPVRSLTRTGNHLVLDLGEAGLNVVYQLDFDGDTVKGRFTFNGDPGFVTGKRRAAGK